MSASKAGKSIFRAARRPLWVAALAFAVALPASGQDDAPGNAGTNGIWKIVPDRTAPVILSAAPEDGSQGANPLLELGILEFAADTQPAGLPRQPHRESRRHV